MGDESRIKSFLAQQTEIRGLNQTREILPNTIKHDTVFTEGIIGTNMRCIPKTKRIGRKSTVEDN
jgi:hypothetical protein